MVRISDWLRTAFTRDVFGYFLASLSVCDRIDVMLCDCKLVDECFMFADVRVCTVDEFITECGKTARMDLLERGMKMFDLASRLPVLDATIVGDRTASVEVLRWRSRVFPEAFSDRLGSTDFLVPGRSDTQTELCKVLIFEGPQWAFYDETFALEIAKWADEHDAPDVWSAMVYIGDPHGYVVWPDCI